jgi:hypothetical protein
LRTTVQLLYSSAHDGDRALGPIPDAKVMLTITGSDPAGLALQTGPALLAARGRRPGLGWRADTHAGTITHDGVTAAFA